MSSCVSATVDAACLTDTATGSIPLTDGSTTYLAPSGKTYLRIRADGGAGAAVLAAQLYVNVSNTGESTGQVRIALKFSRDLDADGDEIPSFLSQDMVATVGVRTIVPVAVGIVAPVSTIGGPFYRIYATATLDTGFSEVPLTITSYRTNVTLNMA